MKVEGTTIAFISSTFLPPTVFISHLIAYLQPFASLNCEGILFTLVARLFVPLQMLSEIIGNISLKSAAVGIFQFVGAGDAQS